MVVRQIDALTGHPLLDREGAAGPSTSGDRRVPLRLCVATPVESTRLTVVDTTFRVRECAHDR